ncbi:hypothetical protein BDR22DRAFT_886240 [Usnea florida]
MAEDDPLLVIKRWRSTVAKMKKIGDENSFARYSNWARQVSLMNQLDNESRFYREEVWSLFTNSDFEKYGRLLRERNPWLEDFEIDAYEDFPRAFQQLAHDPMCMIDVMSAYITLIDCETVKHNLVNCLRRRVEEASKGGVTSRYYDDQAFVNHLVEMLKELRVELDDDTFLQKCKTHNPLAIYICYLEILDTTADTAVKWNVRWQTVMNRSRDFTNIVSPGAQFSTDMNKYISQLRAKAYSQQSRSRENDQREEIKQLRKEKENLEKQVQSYLRAVSDMSYRHLTEMLPIAVRAAANQPPKPIPQSGPDWRGFWQQIWAKAATKTDSPLHALYTNSDKRLRAQIQTAGNELFGTLSANMHHFGKEYDPVKHMRDYVPASILEALKPENFTADGIDWDAEQKRFL